MKIIIALGKFWKWRAQHGLVDPPKLYFLAAIFPVAAAEVQPRGGGVRP